MSIDIHFDILLQFILFWKGRRSHEDDCYPPTQSDFPFSQKINIDQHQHQRRRWKDSSQSQLDVWHQSQTQSKDPTSHIDLEGDCVELKYLAFDDEYLYISWNMDLERMREGRRPCKIHDRWYRWNNENGNVSQMEFLEGSKRRINTNQTIRWDTVIGQDGRKIE